MQINQKTSCVNLTSFYCLNINIDFCVPPLTCNNVFDDSSWTTVLWHQFTTSNDSLCDKETKCLIWNQGGWKSYGGSDGRKNVVKV